jgi:hypothetical protein
MKKLLVTVSAAGLMLGGWKLTQRQHVDDSKVDVTDRLWIDHMPKHDRDRLHVLTAMTHDEDEGGNFGVLWFGSQWQAQYNGFRFVKKGSDLAVEFPQNSWRATWQTKVSRCSVGDFTLCLEITAPRGTFHYFSRDDWEIGSTDAARALTTKLLHEAPRSMDAEPTPAVVEQLTL